MRKQIAKMILLAAIAMNFGMVAQTMASDVIYNPGKHQIVAGEKDKVDHTQCGCLYHQIEDYIVKMFK